MTSVLHTRRESTTCDPRTYTDRQHWKTQEIEPVYRTHERYKRKSKWYRSIILVGRRHKCQLWAGGNRTPHQGRRESEKEGEGE